MRNQYYDPNNVQDFGQVHEYLNAGNSDLLRQAQGPQFTIADGATNSPSFRTGGNWNAAQTFGSPVLGYTDRTSAPELAATQQAALVAAKLPSNQPNNQQGNNFIQGLANSFDPTRAEGSDLLNVDSLLKNKNWNMLYAIDPDKANAVYKNISGGDTFDVALKKRQDQKKFITDTVHSRISNNQLRQDELGNWVEMQDAPDNSPGAMPGATKKSWVPASLQTVDMVNKAGGAEGLGLTSFKSNNPLQIVQQLRQAGWSDAGIKDYVAKNTVQSAKPTGQTQVQAEPLPSKSVEGILPSILGLLGSAGDSYKPSRESQIDRNVRMQDNQQRAAYDDFRSTLNVDPNAVIGDKFSNLIANIFGGTIRNSPDISSPAPTQEQLLKLRAMLTNH